MTLFQKILRVISILHLVFGILLAALIALFFAAGTEVDASAAFDGELTAEQSRIAALIVLGYSLVVELVMFWLCFRASSRAEKVMPILVISMLNVLLMVIQFFFRGTAAFTEGAGLASTALTIVTFFCAVQIKSGR